MCSSESSDLWHVGKTVLDAMGSPASECECSDLDWVCDGCYTSLVYPKPGRKPCKFHKVRIDVLENCLLQLEQKGACTIKDAMVLYKHTISHNYNDAIGDRECASFRKILKAQLQCRGYKCHYPCKQSGSMYYNDSILTGKAVELVYQLMNQTPAKSTVSTEYVTLVKRQVALLPKSSDFDFRTLFDNIKLMMIRYANIIFDDEGNEGHDSMCNPCKHHEPQMHLFANFGWVAVLLPRSTG